MRMTDLPQQSRRAPRVFRNTLMGGALMSRNGMVGSALILVMVYLLIPEYFARAATPTPGYPDSVQVIVHLLDANDLPLVGVMVNLVLNRYGDTVEEIKVGSCFTDATGSCSFTVVDPPRLRSGKIEGFIDLGTYGHQLIGWKGDTFEITLHLFPDGKLATAPVPLDAPYEGQTEQPTDAPFFTSTRTPVSTVTPRATETTLPNTITFTFPTATLTATATTTLTPQYSVTDTPVLTTTHKSSQPTKWYTWVIVSLLLGICVVLWVDLIRMFLKLRKHR